VNAQSASYGESIFAGWSVNDPAVPQSARAVFAKRPAVEADEIFGAGAGVHFVPLTQAVRPREIRRHDGGNIVSDLPLAKRLDTLGTTDENDEEH
jgi:hypothetical protein